MKFIDNMISYCNSLYDLFPDCVLHFSSEDKDGNIKRLCSIECHRCILAYKSSYFFSLFKNEFGYEYFINKKNQYEYNIKIPFNIREDRIREMIYFIYEKELNVEIDIKMIDESKILSDYFLHEDKERLVGKYNDKYKTKIIDNFENEEDIHKKLEIMKQIMGSEYISKGYKKSILYENGHIFDDLTMKLWEKELNCIYYRNKSCKEDKYIFIDYEDNYFTVDGLEFFFAYDIIYNENSGLEYNTYIKLEVINNTNKHLDINIFITSPSYKHGKEINYNNFYGLNYVVDSIPVSKNKERCLLLQGKDIITLRYSQIVIEFLNN